MPITMEISGASGPRARALLTARGGQIYCCSTSQEPPREGAQPVFSDPLDTSDVATVVGSGWLNQHSKLPEYVSSHEFSECTREES